jgi:putative restriction endonuclease
MKSNKYFTKEILKEANTAAIREKRNRAFNESFIDRLEEGVLFPIIDIFYHTKDEIRVTIIFDKEGTIGFLDMSFLRYETLPIAQFNDDGSVTLEDEDSINKRRPYPNNRAWEEVLIKKPVRKQGSFRENVLRAYSNQCAICDINHPRILRAAHIWPVSDGGLDEVQNGIALCVSHEVAYDAQLFSINPDGSIVININDDLKIDYMNIRFPDNNEDYPSVSNFEKRMQFFDKIK